MAIRLLPAFGNEDIVQGNEIARHDFEHFPDETIRTQLKSDQIQGNTALILGHAGSACSIMNTYDQLYGVQRYGAHLAVATMTGLPHHPKNPSEEAFNRYLGHIFSAVPQSPYGTMFLSKSSSGELNSHSRYPRPDSRLARKAREEVTDYCSKLFGISGNSLFRYQSNQGQSWLQSICGSSVVQPFVVEKINGSVSKKPILVSNRRYQYLQKEMANSGRFEEGSVSWVETQGGIAVPDIKGEVRGRSLVIVAGTPSDEDFLELAFLLCNARERGVSDVTVVIPYFGTCRMDRPVAVGDIVTAKTRAALLSALPQPTYGTRFLLFDLHNDATPSFFEGAASCEHVYMEGLMTNVVMTIRNGRIEFSVSPDVGRIKWTRAYAKKYKIGEVVCDKVRVSGSETKECRILIGTKEDIYGKHGLIQDDLTVTCGSLRDAAYEVRKFNPLSLTACVSHLPTKEGSILNLRKSGQIDKLIASNSHPNAIRDKKANPNFVHLVSVAPLAIEAIFAGRMRA